MKTNIFQAIVATTIMLITASLSNAQWGLTVIGPNDTPPKEQWYTRDHKDFNNVICFYGDISACNEVLDRVLGQYGDNHTTGEIEDDAFVWIYFHENNTTTKISYTCTGENWLIQTEVFGYNKDLVAPEWITHSTEMPIGIALIEGRDSYVDHQWFIRKKHRNDRNGAIFYYGTLEECFTQLDNILGDFGGDHTTGEPLNNGFFWFFDQGNGYNLAIFYEENVLDGLTEILMLTILVDFSEEMEFLGIKY